MESSLRSVARVRKHRPQCPQCGSRKFRRDPNTSLLVCRLGHVLQGFRQEETDDGEELSAIGSQSQGRRRRRILKEKNTRARRGDAQRSALDSAWHGDRARYLFFQCLQLILRMQIDAVRRIIPGIPDELEGVCRDLWALKVSLQADLRPQPFLEALTSGASQDDDDGYDSLSASEKRARKRQRRRRAAQDELDTLLEEETEESQRFNDELHSMGISEDESAGAFYSASDRDTAANDDDEEESDDARTTSSTRRGGANSQKRNATEILNLLSILYLGLVSLRVPIMWADLRSLLIEEKLPFLHMAYFLPEDMTRHLPSRMTSWLNPRRVPRVVQLARNTVELANQLHQGFDLKAPQLNCLPLLWRCTERMLLPPTFYRAAKRFLSYVDVSMHPVIAQVADDSSNASRPRYRYFPLDQRLGVVAFSNTVMPRETILMGAVILMAKMRYGLDGERRFEDPGESDLWAGAPVLHDWLSALQGNSSSLAYSKARQITDPYVTDLIDLSDNQLDAYLAHAERSFVFERHPNAFQWRHLRDTATEGDDLLGDSNAFIRRDDAPGEDESLWSSQTKATRNCIRALYNVNSSRRAPTMLDDLGATELRPGEAHGIYERTGDNHESQADASSVHPEYALVLEHASRLVDCDPTEMADTVYALEVELITRLLGLHIPPRGGKYAKRVAKQETRTEQESEGRHEKAKLKGAEGDEEEGADSD